MFRSTMFVLFTMMFGGLLGGGLIGGCGEDAAPGGGGNGGNEQSNQPCQTDENCATGDPCRIGTCNAASATCLFTPFDGDEDGHAPQVCGGDDCDDNNPDTNPGATEIADGIDNDCDGVVDGFPPGANLGPCGGAGKNECRGGLSCLTCAEANLDNCDGSVCTCPQWFGGRWWAEFAEVRRTDGQEYDFMAPGLDRQFWEDQEVAFEQSGCTIRGPDRQFLWSGGTGEVKLSPTRFYYERMWEDVDGNRNHPLQSIGEITADKGRINGTCSGEYRNWSDLTLFPITCSFTLTRN